MNDQKSSDTALPAADMATSRREFLGRGAVTGLSVGILGGLITQSAFAQGDKSDKDATTMDKSARVELFPGAVNAQGQYALPPLPYDYKALEPHIDAETMQLHHDVHHKGYVDGLIKAEDGLAKARESGDNAAIEALLQKASFHGGGHFLHCIFWASMGPSGGQPEGDLLDGIKTAFGSVDALQKQFSAAATTVEGSGWGMLAYSVPARKLGLLQVRNHNLSTQWANIPLLVLDVWEHAYYKKYGPKRADYVKAFSNVINWQDICKRYAAVREMFG